MTLAEHYKTDAYVGLPEWDYRALIVGQAQSARCPEYKPLWRQDFMDLSGGARKYELGFERHNLLRYFPGKSGDTSRGDAFPVAEASRNAKELLAARCSPERGARVLALGRNVFRSMTGFRGKYFDTVELVSDDYAATICLFPHPSRVNTFWNDYDNRKNASKFFRDFLEKTMRRRARGRRIKV